MSASRFAPAAPGARRSTLARDPPRAPGPVAPARHCTGIEKLTPGPNAVGSKLRYAFREGSRVGTMDGVITARVPNQHLACRYDDKMPKTFAGKVFAPLIRKQLPKQTIAAMGKLRELLERGAA